MAGETDDKGMNFGIDSVEKIVSHWMLQNTETAKAIGQTEDWRSGQKLTARVTVNGIELPFADLDAFVADYLDRQDKKRAEAYADLDQEVGRRVEAVLEGRAKPIIEAMSQLQNTLADAGSILKPWWEAPSHV